MGLIPPSQLAPMCERSISCGSSFDNPIMCVILDSVVTCIVLPVSVEVASAVLLCQAGGTARKRELDPIRTVPSVALTTSPLEFGEPRGSTSEAVAKRRRYCTITTSWCHRHHQHHHLPAAPNEPKTLHVEASQPSETSLYPRQTLPPSIRGCRKVIKDTESRIRQQRLHASGIHETEQVGS